MPGSAQTHKEALVRLRRAIGRYPRPPVTEGGKISTKSLSRQIHRLVEHTAGRPEYMRAREARLKAAKIREERTGSTRPVDTSRPRGAKKVYGRITVGHPSVRSRYIYHGVPVEEATTEAKIIPQDERSNYGRMGQQARSIPEWQQYLAGTGRGVWPDMPTELDPNKSRNAARGVKTYGPAPKIGKAAGFTGRLPVVANPLAAIAEFAFAKALGKDYTLNDFLTTSILGPGSITPRAPKGQRIPVNDGKDGLYYDDKGNIIVMG